MPSFGEEFISAASKPSCALVMLHELKVLFLFCVAAMQRGEHRRNKAGES